MMASLTTTAPPFETASNALPKSSFFVDKVPITENVTHHDDINFRRRVFEEISRSKPHSVVHLCDQQQRPLTDKVLISPEAWA